MRPAPWSHLDRYRIQLARRQSPTSATYGDFALTDRPQPMAIVAVDGEDTGWEHVSVSLRNRCPNWLEMCEVKDLFWLPEETVIQYHPASSAYVNTHPYCLHLWRPVSLALPLPPTWMV